MKASVWHSLRRRIYRRLHEWIPKNKRDYQSWIRLYDSLTEMDSAAIKRQAQALKYRPLISVLMPVYNLPPDLLRRAIESVQSQLYPEWELCVADDASTLPEIRALLQKYQSADPRIKVVFRPQNGHISAASNSALAIAQGEFAALLDHDDELAPHALHMVAHELNDHPGADLIYTDEDKIDLEQHRFEPYFKPAWNPDLLLSQNYISHLGVYRTALLKSIGGFRIGLEGSQDHDLVLRFSTKTVPEKIHHIPHVLYHWRVTPGSTATAGKDPKPYARLASRRAVTDFLAEQNISAEVGSAPSLPDFHRVQFRIAESAPRVSIVIGCNSNSEFSQKCLDSIQKLTRYKNYEVVMIYRSSHSLEPTNVLAEEKNASRVSRHAAENRFYAGKFFNLGCERATGEILTLLHDDVEITDPDWLSELVSQASRPGIGIVGGKLLYPDGYVQHAGSILGGTGLVRDAFRFRPADYPEPMGRPLLTQSFTAVSSACMAFRKEVYTEVKGFGDWRSLKCNEIDFCLRVQSAGYTNLYTPFACLNHFGEEEFSLSERIFRFIEAGKIRRQWGEQLKNDPAYNPNLSLGLYPFDLAFPPRSIRPWIKTDS